MPGPISKNGNFYSNNASSPKIPWFQISFKLVKPFAHKKSLRILQLPIPTLYLVPCSLHLRKVHQGLYWKLTRVVWWSNGGCGVFGRGWMS